MGWRDTQTNRRRGTHHRLPSAPMQQHCRLTNEQTGSSVSWSRYRTYFAPRFFITRKNSSSLITPSPSLSASSGDDDTYSNRQDRRELRTSRQDSPTLHGLAENGIKWTLCFNKKASTGA